MTDTTWTDELNPNLDAFLPVIGKATKRMIEMARVFVGQGETLLISGSTGSGKSRLARWCHEQSPRREQRFEVLDLLSVPANLQMAELVGWKRGAFTGATHNVAGALTRAARGTLFIDEIDKLSLEAQSGLLRILEDRRYRALGDGTQELRAEVQFIIGTNTDLRAAVRQGRFREDLYYRINVLPVRLPDLAERIDEVPRWAAFMLARCSESEARQVTLTNEASATLCRHSWPGNLRQLDNVIRRAYAFAVADQAVDDLRVEACHVTSALGFEDGSDDGVTSQLWRAAQVFAREVVRRGQSGAASLPLELIDGFRGMVLGATVQQLGSREEAFLLFEREHLLNGRNHHRALKRELGKTQELVRALGDGDVGPELRALMQVAAPARSRRGEADQVSSIEGRVN